MDLTWITDRIAVGGGIWNAANMAELAALGVTHIVNMQIEFDERALAAPHNIEVLWNPVDDDFLPKPPDVFQRGVRFAQDALASNGSRLYVHCAAGVHRGPTMALAILCAQGYDIEAAKRLIQEKRYVVDWAEVYVKSVEDFLKSYASVNAGS